MRVGVGDTMGRSVRPAFPDKEVVRAEAPQHKSFEHVLAKANDIASER
jgi:hypothetical protein